MSRVIAITGGLVGVEHFGASSNAVAGMPVNQVQRLDPADYVNFSDVYQFNEGVDFGPAHLDFLDALMSAYWRARTWTGTVDFSAVAAGSGDIYAATGPLSIWTPTNLQGAEPIKEWDFVPMGPLRLAYNSTSTPGDPNFTITGTRNGGPQAMSCNLAFSLNYHEGVFYASVQVLFSADLGADLVVVSPKRDLVPQPGPDPFTYNDVGQSTVSPRLGTGLPYDFTQRLYDVNTGTGFAWSACSATITLEPDSYWENAKNDGSEPVWNSVTGAKILSPVPNKAILPP